MEIVKLSDTELEIMASFTRDHEEARRALKVAQDRFKLVSGADCGLQTEFGADASGLQLTTGRRWTEPHWLLASRVGFNAS
jgi:hypothetical protein